MTLSDDLEQEFLAIDRGEKPKDIIKPMLWSAENGWAVKRVCGMMPCTPEERQVMQHYFLKSKKYDLLYAMILNSEGGAFNFEANLHACLKPLGTVAPPPDSINSLDWCINNEELINIILGIEPVSDTERRKTKERLKKQERYDLLFLLMKRETIINQANT